MAYDEQLVDRVRECLRGQAGVTEKRMFGSLAFLLDGALTVAVSGRGGLMVKVDPDDRDELLTRPHVGPVVMRGSPTRGWVRVEVQALGTDDALRSWVQRAAARARAD